MLLAVRLGEADRGERRRGLLTELLPRFAEARRYAGLEEAAGVTATICGKPAPAFFESALALLGATADRVAMVGDDIVNDVLGAQAAGLTGVLVRTGKFREEDLGKGDPDLVVDSIVDLPAIVAG